jgi:(1->4)-alpha-D-glucan 1-alpha-D-glucosylmutase
LRATYRLQLTPQLGFAAASRLVPYLRDLGVSHLYLSPSLQARAGSTHGYDVVEPHRLSEELGGRAAFEELARAAHGAGLGIVLDVVPNHMAAVPESRYWADEGLRGRFFDIDPVSGRHRRFFDIDDLAGVRQEDLAVFEETHELVLELVRQGLVDGLRVDHPDGLADPAGYLERLRSDGVERVWVEKILDPCERLREWPVCGTVGYEFLNDVCALFVEPEAAGPLTRLWESVSGDRRTFGEVALEAKLEQVRGTFQPEVERLARLVPDLPREVLEHGLAGLPVYRTYVDPAAGEVADADRGAVSNLDPALRSLLLLERPAPNEFVTRFQQTTPAVMAKGVEDTAFYRYGRLLALNDVGGDPSRFGIGVERFHAGCRERLERFSQGLVTTMTHDAKRSADVRARIAALTWLPDEWSAFVDRAFALMGSWQGDAPDALERYFLLQTLAGAWPISVKRVTDYMEKALREAKRNSNWVAPDLDWESRVRRFCEMLCADQPFLELLGPLIERVGRAGERIALAQLVLKLTVPGVPDIYQGDELPFRALVDPDNRRAVDWQWHRAMLDRLMGEGRPTRETMKLFVTLRLLGLRVRRPDAFAEGSYEPLDAAPDCCAFLRGGEVLVAVALRAGPTGAAVSAPSGRWRDVLTGNERSFAASESLERLLSGRPAAVFERVGRQVG